MRTNDIEYHVAKFFSWRQNLIVPNVSWGLGFDHELDLMVVKPSGYAYEIEIKISKSDLKADLKKRHEHKSNRIRRLYFAIPETLNDCIEFIPKHAGIIVARALKNEFIKIEIIRVPRENKEARKLSDGEILKLCKLASMRVWRLKEHLKGKIK